MAADQSTAPAAPEGELAQFCHKCKQTKPVAELYVRRQKAPSTRPPSNLSDASRAARRENVKKARAARAANLDGPVGDRGHLSYCKACVKATLRAYRLEHPEWSRATVRRHRMMRKYGLTKAAYEEKLAAQSGACAICLRAETRRHRGGKTWALSVDHDHATGATRDLLCSRCNALLGHAEDGVPLLEACIAYLKRHAVGPGPVAQADRGSGISKPKRLM